jgi:CRP-like cAMP-binding protein
MFGSVGIDELFRIAGAAEQTRHELDAPLLQEDTVPDNLYVLLDGRIEASARRAVPWEIVPPATLGLEEVLNGSVMSHTLKTLEPSVTLKLSSQVMGTLLADNTDLVQGFFRTLTGRGPSSAEIPAIMKGEAEQELLQLSAGQLTPIQKVLALQRISIFSRVSAGEMRHLAEIARQVELLEGELLSGETDPPLVCILLSGSLSVETPGGSSPAQQATAGDAVGMHEALAGTSSGKTGTSPKRLTVLETGAALRIDSDDLFDLLGQRPNLLQQIFSALFGTKAQAS